MNAKEAYELATKSDEVKIHHPDYVQIQKWIIKHATDKKLNFYWLSDYIEPSVIKTLKDEGFILRKATFHKTPCYKISWGETNKL